MTSNILSKVFKSEQSHLRVFGRSDHRKEDEGSWPSRVGDELGQVLLFLLWFDSLCAVETESFITNAILNQIFVSNFGINTRSWTIGIPDRFVCGLHIAVLAPEKRFLLISNSKDAALSIRASIFVLVVTEGSHCSFLLGISSSWVVCNSRQNGIELCKVWEAPSVHYCAIGSFFLKNLSVGIGGQEGSQVGEFHLIFRKV